MDGNEEGKPDLQAIKNEVKIQAPTDLMKVESVFNEIRDRYHVSEKKIREMVLVAGELGENILKHCGHGTLSIGYHPAETPYVEIISENIGQLPANAEENGVTTKRSLGIGLGIVSRTSDVFTHEQDGMILRLHAIKYCDEFPARTEVAALSYPVMPCEKCNGDTFFIHKNYSDLFCVVDALGHGEEAYKSATAVHGFIQENPNRKIDTLIYETHDFLRARHLRGVAFSAVRVDYAQNSILFCGLGDVMVKIFLPDEEKTLYPLPKEGIVGDVHRTLEIQTFPIVRGATIAMFSDGLSSKLTLAVPDRAESPVVLVNDLMKQYGKTYDDRTLLLARIL